MSNSDCPFIPVWLDKADLSPVQFKVLCNLWRRRNFKTHQCNPSIELIAADCKMSTRTVMRALDALKRAGLIAREKGCSARSNRYILATPSMTLPSWDSDTGVSITVTPVSSNSDSGVTQTVTSMSPQGVPRRFPSNLQKEGTKEGSESPATCFSLSNGDLGQTSELPSPPPSAAPPPAPSVKWTWEEMEAMDRAKQRKREYLMNGGRHD